MMRRQVKADAIAGNGIWNPFTGNKTWTVTCGDCRHTYKDTVPLVEAVSSLCPCCGAQNTWSARNFFRQYEASK